MPSSRKRRSSSSSSSDSGDTPSPPQAKKSGNRNALANARRHSSPRRNSFGANLNQSMHTPTKYVGNDRAGLERYLAERNARKHERDFEKEEMGRDEKRKRDMKESRRKMKPVEKSPPREEEKETKKEDVCAPNYQKSGKLAEETNTYKGIVIKYSEPQEARIPKTKWRLYPFKGDDSLPTMYIHRNSGYLIGRERKVVDIPADHPSCSSQHAVIQFRLVDHTRQDGSETKKVKPYLMDLESTNGTFLNNNKVEGRRYYELKERDIIKFGFSTREYVLLHERSEGVNDHEG